MGSIPHVIPYQGSKRRIAKQILSYISSNTIETIYEPFAGSAAITIAAAYKGISEKYVIGDKLEPLVKLWEIIVNEPNKLIIEYKKLWNDQLDDPISFYYEVRDEFNNTKSPVLLFYLIARCVKNAIRFNPSGEFNQSPDKRRLGMKPEKLEKQVLATSRLLKGKTQILGGDFTTIIKNANERDLIYMDPPWAGLKKNPRYAYQLQIENLIEELYRLNKKKIPYMLSFDGVCGDRSYIYELPEDLQLKRLDIFAGRSTQSTLLGRNEKTIESLYISPYFVENNNIDNSDKQNVQMKLFR